MASGLTQKQCGSCTLFPLVGSLVLHSLPQTLYEPDELETNLPVSVNTSVNVLDCMC